MCPPSVHVLPRTQNGGCSTGTVFYSPAVGSADPCPPKRWDGVERGARGRGSQDNTCHSHCILNLTAQQCRDEVKCQFFLGQAAVHKDDTSLLDTTLRMVRLPYLLLGLLDILASRMLHTQWVWLYSKYREEGFRSPQTRKDKGAPHTRYTMNGTCEIYFGIQYVRIAL